ncbi:hypothetical protein ACFOZ5_18075 [Marinobacter lacisalsi]|uniref:DsrE/DsrF-like family protein n=1 Tax=Marinobacter lacisalsi TaxID=475979 RepID=A0ABV8QKT3_9GAMM
MPRLLTTLVAATLLATAPLISHADQHGDTADKVLVILSSDSLQTQGMAMVLSNTMAQQGAQVNVLLCDQAGDLALKSYSADALKPKDLTPGQMLRGLAKQGGEINVCALYLPNSDYTQEDLMEGVGVATPPDMAGQMLDPEIRIFSF